MKSWKEAGAIYQSSDDSLVSTFGSAGANSGSRSDFMHVVLGAGQSRRGFVQRYLALSQDRVTLSRRRGQSKLIRSRLIIVASVTGRRCVTRSGARTIIFR